MTALGCEEVAGHPKKTLTTDPGHISAEARQGRAGQEGGGLVGCETLSALGELSRSRFHGEERLVAGVCQTWRRIIKRSSTTNTVCTRGSET